jgi:hypothetical protein
MRDGGKRKETRQDTDGRRGPAARAKNDLLAMGVEVIQWPCFCAWQSAPPPASSSTDLSMTKARTSRTTMHPSSGTTGGWGANTKDWGRVKQSWQEQERARQRLELIGVDEWEKVLPYHLLLDSHPGDHGRRRRRTVFEKCITYTIPTALSLISFVHPVPYLPLLFQGVSGSVLLTNRYC